MCCMPQFFIKRPIFAWVVALFIVLAGLLAIPKLPIAQYPSVAPPSLIISLSWPGASPESMNTSAISLLEREIAGVDNLLYFESASDTSGYATITVTFKPGTDLKVAQMDLQNQIKAVEPRLPQTVRQNGLMVEAANPSFLMMVGLKSKDGRYQEADLSDYFARNVTESLRRVAGVGKVQLFGAEKALRIWVDPVKLETYGLSISDVIDAISRQNQVVSAGRLGDAPAPKNQAVTYPITVKGQLSSVNDFKNITLKSDSSGARVKIEDVARVELGMQNYTFGILDNGVPATAAAIQLTPGANAIETADGVRAVVEELSGLLPEGVEFIIPFDTSPFVKLSIHKVLQTFVEAMILVFLVMLLFLHNLRCTLIPAIVAPIALLGTLAVMLPCGYSINILTMFGMVLAIGIIVDDAIVVVENVERLINDERLSPVEATQKAMKEITPAIIGITLVLTAVFIPMAFAAGSVGIIYRQFCISMAVSILFSAFLALSLTPALCATLLKPACEEKRTKGGFARQFDCFFLNLSNKYGTSLQGVLKRSFRMMLLYSILLVVLFFAFAKLPSSFLPEEDQGFFITTIQLPTDATRQRTVDVVDKMEQDLKGRNAVKSNITILGFGFAGSGPNTALSFTTLKDWDERKGHSAQQEANFIQEKMENVLDADSYSLLPPAIPELGNSSGFTFYLQDRGAKGYQQLKAAADELVLQANQSDKLANVYIDGLPPGSSISLKVDREKAEAFDVPFEEINQVISTGLGSYYVNDFTNNGRVQQVIVQADENYRMRPEEMLKLSVKSRKGEMVSLSSLVEVDWHLSPQQLQRYLGYPSIRISGGPAVGVSTGTAIEEMNRLAKELPSGFYGQWSGISLQEIQSAKELPLLLALSILVVIMVLAALYESWSIPFAVILVVPLGIIGAVCAVFIGGISNDVFFKIGLITLIGLSAKNAILIIEFAQQIRNSGKSVFESAITASKLRLRPIIMTSLAFTLGVVPLMLATGASDKTQHSIGTGVFGGMISATFLAIYFVPVFYCVVLGIKDFFDRRKR